MRQQITWRIGADQIFASLDIPDDRSSKSALIIVSGGNEIRSGSHNSQSQLAQYMSAKGYYVLRYDRRGVGDSEGENTGFENSRDDILAAAQFMREKIGPEAKISAFGNCDAASALILNCDGLGINALILANPWTYDPIEEAPESNEVAHQAPSAAAIRARYWARIKNPRSLIDLFSGKIDLSKLIKGLMRASKKEELSIVSQAISRKLSDAQIPIDILIADKDSTAMAYMGAHNSKAFAQVRENPNVKISKLDSASHSFADKPSKAWLYDKLSAALDR